MQFQIVRRDVDTLEEIERESRRFETRQDARRMVAQYAAQLTKGVYGLATPPIREYLAHSGYDFIRVLRYSDGAPMDIGVVRAASKGGRR
jgi:hypothetical protein